MTGDDDTREPEQAPGDEAERDFFAEPVDQELVSLPTPKKRGRNPWIMGAVVLVSILILWWFRFEVGYFFASGEPVDLGTAVDLETADLRTNTYATVEAWPNVTRAVKFSRRLNKDTYRIVPVVGNKKLFLQVRRSPDEEDASGGDISELEGRFSGRLVSFGDLDSTFLTRGGYKSIRMFFREKLYIEIDDDCYLLMADVTPRSYWIYLLLALVVAGFGIVNAVLLVRHLLAARGRRPAPKKS